MTANEYKEIKKTINTELETLEREIQSLLNDETPLNKQLTSFLTTNAKRLRPIVGLLFSKLINQNINKNQEKILLAVELIHNASLIHDDVIDEAQTRRDEATINTKFDSNLAVVAGDFLLSIAFEKIIETNSIEVLKLFTSALKQTCVGEINQYFNKFLITSLDEYIKKSERKTALLFELATLGCVILSDEELNTSTKQKAVEFAKNFGIAFQIRDDLLNTIKNAQDNDIKSGIYTAPLIFAQEENKNILQEEDLFEAIKSTKGIEKTKDLMDNYFNKALNTIKDFENNEYKNALIKLINQLKEDRGN